VCLSTLGIATPDMTNAVNVRAGVLAQTSLLAQLPPQDEARLSGPMFQPTSLTVGYVRSPHYSTFDPLHSALQLLASVEVHAALPEEETASEFWDALIIASPDGGGFGAAEIERFREIHGHNIPVICLLENPQGLGPADPTAGAALKLPVTLAELNRALQHIAKKVA
jgi:hypothetical protein